MPENKFQVAEKEITKAIKSVGKTFDTKAFIALMEKFEAKVEEIKAEAKEIRVRGAESEKKAVKIGGFAKALGKVVDAARMSAKRPYLDFNQQLDGMVMPIVKTLKAIEADQKSKCKKYRKELLDKQRAAEAEAAKAPPIEFAGLKVGRPKVVKEAAGTVATDTSAGASYRTVKTFTLVDIKKVPAEYLMVDWKKVKQAQKDGITAIPGFELTEDIDMTMKS